MTDLWTIEDFLQNYIEAISAILDVEVTILDKNLRRVSGTGKYKTAVGSICSHSSFFGRVLKDGKPGVIYDVKQEFACSVCSIKEECDELANIAYPIKYGNEIIGITGIIAFTFEQRENLLKNIDKLMEFLNYMNQLLEGKILITEKNLMLKRKIRNAIQDKDETMSFDDILTKDISFNQVKNTAKVIANSPSSVLITGDSGTGKELMARAIHNESLRKNEPFIAINCASIPETLFESELFGYEKGSFTGATSKGKAGKFELANKGTIFLDEIGEIPISMQPKLLRVLQEKKVDRIGSSKPIEIDVRVIAATNRDLEKMIKENKFREDLYYRINVIPLNIPPLNERKEDIELLANSFLCKLSKLLAKDCLKIDTELMTWLKSYDWPGNVRQLKNIMEYMVNMSCKETLTLDCLPAFMLKKIKPFFKESDSFKESTDIILKEEINLDETVQNFEKSILIKYLENASSTEEKENIAKKLNISLATLYRKIKKYNIKLKRE